MAGEELPSWFRDLHSDLQRRAYVSNGEPAWPESPVLQVIQQLTSRSCRVIGIEVWLPTKPGPTVAGPPYYWEPLRPADTSVDAIRATNAEAQEFIRRFKPHPADAASLGHELYFNLAVDCDMEPPR